MRNVVVRRVALLFVAASAASGGCAHWQQAPGGGLVSQFASALGDGPPRASGATAKRPSRGGMQTANFTETTQRTTGIRPEGASEVQLAHAQLPVGCDECCDAGAPPCAACCCPVLGACGSCSACLAGHQCCLFSRPEPGPPPVRYRPELPPKFLPVPTEPTLSPARPDAPEPWRGDVEVGWRPELRFPGRD